MSPRTRAMAAMIASATTVGLSFGVMMPLLSLVLEREGVDTALIGLNTAAASLAILCTGPLMPRLVGRLGLLPACHLGILVSAAVLFVLPLWVDVWFWFPLRFVAGLAVGLQWVASETWISALATSRDRGRVLGIYLTLMAAGFSGGPLVLGAVGTAGWLPFGVSGGLLLLGSLPLLLARGLSPPVPARPPTGVFRIVRLAPFAMVAALLGGVSDLSVLAMLPLYVLHSGYGQEFAMLVLSAVLLGNVALQLPLGWLADRWSPEALLMVLAGAGIAAPLALPFAFAAGWLLWPLLFLWGGAIFGLYTAGLTLLGAQVRPAELTAANAAFVMIFEAGSFSGPILSGAAMERWDPQGFVVALAGACFLFMLFAMLRRRRLRRPE